MEDNPSSLSVIVLGLVEYDSLLFGGNMQLIGNFLIAHLLEAVHDECLPVTGRQRFYGLFHHFLQFFQLIIIGIMQQVLHLFVENGFGICLNLLVLNLIQCFMINRP